MDSQNEKKFISAYDQFSGAIFRYCYLRVYNRDLAKDLVQETFLRTWDYVSEGKEILNFKPFLYKVACNLIIDESRKKKAVSLDLLKEKGLEPRLNPREGFFERIDAKMAIETIRKMDEKYRDAILLRYVEDLSVKEIAKILGESEDNISVRLHRGLQKLREILENHGNNI